jgi:hypothetical protein
MKRCTRCKEEKPLKDFCRCSRLPDGLWIYCRECEAKRRVGNKDKYREYSRRYRERYPRAQARAQRKFKYGITHEEFEGMLLGQQGVCAICLTHIVESTAEVDHCHVTGKVRGLLCNQCNKGLGNFRDDPEFLRRAVLYLQADEVSP